MTRKERFSEGVQRFGRSLLLPIAIMAPMGMILGLTGALVQGYMIERVPFLANETLQLILVSLRTIADVIFSNIPVLFAMGVAYGMSRKEKGIAVFSSMVSYLILNITINVYLKATGTLAEAAVMSQVGQGMVLGIQSLRLDVLGGIISGLISAFAADKYYNKELPVAFAFFSGKKFVPMVSIVWSTIVGLIIPFFWSYLTKGLVALSSVILKGAIGPFINELMVRLLIPLGLHHVWSALIRFTPAGGTYVIAGETFTGVLPALNEVLFKQGPNSEAWAMLPELTKFMAQNQMLVTLFMIPAMGLAMYKSAFAKNRPFVKGIILTMVITPFLGNITEPMEFSFLFIAPLLYLVYALLASVGSVALYLLGTGVGYIRGTIFDFAIFGLMYENTRWYNLLIVGIPLAVATYFIFKYAIQKYNIATPGRESDEYEYNNLIKEKRYNEVAKIVIESLGGPSNIVNVDNCVTRLRIDLVDMKLVNKDTLKDSGTSGIFFPMKNHIHIVFGPNVEFVKNAVTEELKMIS